jgi:arabinogalactan endo-1,4-beta-galactosidase
LLIKIFYSILQLTLYPEKKLSMKKILFAIFALCAIIFFGCSKSNSSTNNNHSVVPPPDTTTNTAAFAKGADISWLTQMESSGYLFYDSAGTQEDCIQILKGLGMNAIRLRAWVNPANGWCNTNDVVVKALRAKALGMKIMIDFHYSDTWADPGDQTKPAAWTALIFDSLVTTLYNYTLHVMDTLIQVGVTPTWVQVGNETNDGMLWTDGQISTNGNSFVNFAALVNSGYNAVKAASDSTKVIVHISNGFDNSLFEWMFDGLKAAGAKWDIIGMSLYPATTSWQTTNAQCLENMNDMVSRYGTPVMVCEVGMSYSDVTDSQAFLTDIIAKTKSVTNGNGLGVFYWEPESYNNWQGYSLGAFDNTGKPTAALNAFEQ